KAFVTFFAIRADSSRLLFICGLSEKTGRLQPSLCIPAPTPEATSLPYANTLNHSFHSMLGLPSVECR
ncbi:MAG: hypothetical protein LBF04_06685, partial [Prevotellaceae bacterium]|nr:hypothetical protein [Prevotellaceae bacterium]